MPPTDFLKVDVAYTDEANLRFRTITTMLRAFHVHQDRQFPIVDSGETKNLKLQRQVLTALATLFVKNREVVAVTWRGGSPRSGVTLVTMEQSAAASFEGSDIPIEHIAMKNENLDKTPAKKPLSRKMKGWPPTGGFAWQEHTDHSPRPRELSTTLKEVLQYVHSNKSEEGGGR